MILFAKRWVQWLLVLLGVLVLSQAVGWLLTAQGAGTAGNGVQLAGVALADLWVLFGLWRGRARRWVQWAAAIVIGSHAVGFLCFALWAGDSRRTAIAVAGVWAMGLAFFLGLLLIRFLLSYGHPILGVARTLVDEAVRMKIALVFIVCLAFLVPVLPMLLDPKELLNYRVKTFLDWSISGIAVLLGLMTIFLSCGTICGEIQKKQIYLTMSKPIRRGEYLLGKWLGIVLLDLLLLTVAGMGVYVFTMMLQRSPARDPLDRVATDEQVLVARVSAAPQPPQGMDFNKLVGKRVEQLRREDPDRYGTAAQPREIPAKDMAAIQASIIAKWHTIPPLNGGVYLFRGLGAAKAYGERIQLRFEPQAAQTPPDAMVRLALWLNGAPWPMIGGRHRTITVSNNTYHIINLPVEALDAGGNLELRIANVNLENPRATFPTSVSFTPGTGLEVLYRVGDFAGNLVRGLTLIWLELAFLAALGLMAGTFLGFPVACLLAILVYVVGVSSSFLAESLNWYTQTMPKDLSVWDKLLWFPAAMGQKLTTGQFWDVVKLTIKLVGNLVVWLLPSFSDYNPTPFLADGRLVSYHLLGQGALWIGLVWMGGCLLLGWVIFRRRELATATT